MSEETSLALEIIKEITGFFSENIGWIVLITLIVVAKDAISDLIKRLTNLNYRKGDSEFGVKAAAPTVDVLSESNINENASKNESVVTKEDSKPEVTSAKHWFTKFKVALNKGLVNEAKEELKQYEVNENDASKRESNKAMCLYYLFTDGADNGAIDELNKLIVTAGSDGSKFNAVQWLSLCYRESMDHKREVELWERYLDGFNEPELNNDSHINYAKALAEMGKFDEAKKILIDRAKVVDKDLGKAKIYRALSAVESEAGNKMISLYSRDMALEYDPNNRDELFDTAYQASNEGFNELSISSYDVLLRIDSNNQWALNNVGVTAKEVGANTKAVENYKMASVHGNTLAMANQGNMLLDAGFVEEAREIANAALSCERVHENVYGLLSRIKKVEKKDDEKWKGVVDDSFEYQKHSRGFINAYYEKDIPDIDLVWATESDEDVFMGFSSGELKATWVERSSPLSSHKYNVEFSGAVHGGAVQGVYKKEKNTNGERHVLPGLLGSSGNVSKKCLGYFNERGELMIFSIDSKDAIRLKIKQKQ